MELRDPKTIDDPEEVIGLIRGVQASLTELQHRVIRGELTPQAYMEEERRRVAHIHGLEERLAVLTGQAPPERQVD